MREKMLYSTLNVIATSASGGISMLALPASIFTIPKGRLVITFGVSREFIAKGLAR